jgi:putative transposase
MKLRYNYRIYPDDAQQEHLAKTFGCVRVVYNNALAKRTAAFKDNNVRMNFNTMSAALTLLKKEHEYVWLNEVSSVALQQSLDDLQTAFQSFFAKRAKYPNFKKKTGHQSARYTNNAFKFTDGNRLSIAKIGLVKIKMSRKMPSAPSSVTVIRNPSGQYFASFVVEKNVNTFNKTGQSIGIDFGIKSFACLSNGEEIVSQKLSRDVHKRRKLLAKRLAKKKQGSKRRELARKKLAKLELNVSNRRKDFQHKFTTDIIKRFDVIAVEDLNLRGMVKNHNLARSISDAAIGATISMIEEKAKRYGKVMVKIDRFFPSTQLCSCCGAVNKQMKNLSKRFYECVSCDNTMSRDLNAAKNILAVGHTVLEHGDGVRQRFVNAS